MKSLLVSDIFPPQTGGSGRWFWEIYRRLPREEVVIAAGEDPRQTEFDQTHDLVVERTPLRMREWGIRSWEGAKGYWRTVAALRTLVKKHRIDRIHCARCLPEGVMALILNYLTGTPYVCYVHGEDVNTATQSRELTWLVRRVLRRARFMICNSENSANLLRNDWQIPESQIRVLHPGCDIERFVPAERSDAVRGELGWGSRRVLVTVGRLQRRKGHDQMIRALKTIRQSVPDVLYSIVGTGEELTYLTELAQQEGVADAVQFRGEVSDAEMVRCYQQCDLFVLPNRQIGKDIEGFGMVLLEAQACGRPVVAGDSGGTAETMRIPETGRVVNCDGPEALAVLVSSLLCDSNLRETMGRAGRQWVVENFGWEPLAARARQLFTE